ncbi:succinate dehydrogenase hydrophobic membrane anchor subunit [Demequina sp. NBRC 110052]|uniref:succinate dehydrogenase hydrophobic membrane anchor subunit n=1 Tax=Demequina sp. NBRC 110052 TaxID=1570341 RepID=UPI000A044D90|nr:succinate dehydrogenase hydrophobic membrane anchor subunit [Demequina sp. NBRC 110052]
MTAPELSTPRERIRSGRMRRNAERWSWLFMRFSGALLLVLIFTHLFVNLMTGDGVQQIDFAFVAGKWASPLWKVWDLLMLVLAMIHGGNGMRLLINDYAHRPRVRTFLLWLLGIAVVVVIVLGSLVIFTFDPCPLDASGDLLSGVPDFCKDVR